MYINYDRSYYGPTTVGDVGVGRVKLGMCSLGAGCRFSLLYNTVLYLCCAIPETPACVAACGRSNHQWISQTALKGFCWIPVILLQQTTQGSKHAACLQAAGLGGGPGCAGTTQGFQGVVGVVRVRLRWCISPARVCVPNVGIAARHAAQHLGGPLLLRAHQSLTDCFTVRKKLPIKAIEPHDRVRCTIYPCRWRQ